MNQQEVRYGDRLVRKLDMIRVDFVYQRAFDVYQAEGWIEWVEFDSRSGMVLDEYMYEADERLVYDGTVVVSGEIPGVDYISVAFDVRILRRIAAATDLGVVWMIRNMEIAAEKYDKNSIRTVIPIVGEGWILISGSYTAYEYANVVVDELFEDDGVGKTYLTMDKVNSLSDPEIRGRVWGGKSVDSVVDSDEIGWKQ